MGTRSITYIHDNSFDEAPFTAIYRQMDGYPSGQGDDIKKALGDQRLVNGISGDRSKVVNGMGCAAAKLIKALKDEAGNIYVEAANIEPDGVDYVYRLAPGDGVVLLKAIYRRDDTVLFEGPVSDFNGEAIEAATA
jgi:hypothetical protein